MRAPCAVSSKCSTFCREGRAQSAAKLEQAKTVRWTFLPFDAAKCIFVYNSSFSLVILVHSFGLGPGRMEREHRRGAHCCDPEEARPPPHGAHWPPPQLPQQDSALQGHLPGPLTEQQHAGARSTMRLADVVAVLRLLLMTGSIVLLSCCRSHAASLLLEFVGMDTLVWAGRPADNIHHA